jgi:hypothetical protein
MTLHNTAVRTSNTTSVHRPGHFIDITKKDEEEVKKKKTEERVREFTGVEFRCLAIFNNTTFQRIRPAKFSSLSSMHNLSEIFHVYVNHNADEGS